MDITDDDVADILRSLETDAEPPTPRPVFVMPPRAQPKRDGSFTIISLATEARAIRDSVETETPLTGEPLERLSKLCGLLDKDCPADQIRSIAITERLGSRHIRMTLADGSTRYASLRNKSRDVKVAQAFRASVADDCTQHLDRYFSAALTTNEAMPDPRAPSELSGALAFRSDIEVDHAPPNTFAVILADFLRRRALSIDDIAIRSDIATDLSVDVVHHRLADAELARAFREYHAGRAQLRCITTNEHAIITAEARRR